MSPVLLENVDLECFENKHQVGEVFIMHGICALK